MLMRGPGLQAPTEGPFHCPFCALQQHDMADPAPSAPAAATLPKTLAFKAISFRAFASQLLGGQDRLGALLQDTQLPQDSVRHMLDPALDSNDDVDEATFMTQVPC